MIFRPPIRVVVLAFACGVAALTTASCSDSPPPSWSTSSPELEGLPADVSAERLADPSFVETLNAADPADQATMLQLQVASTVFCRDAYAEYLNWLSAGTPPQTPQFAEPSKPEPGFDDFATSWETQFGNAIASGDPEVLRSTLTAAGGCDGVVVDPTADDTTTIADALNQS